MGMCRHINVMCTNYGDGPTTNKHVDRMRNSIVIQIDEESGKVEWREALAWREDFIGTWIHRFELDKPIREMLDKRG